MSKEPTTIVWLETFARDEVLLDVAANVGMYSIYGAIVGARVFAFEPEALNYAELNKNIYANGLHDRVTAYCMHEIVSFETFQNRERHGKGGQNYIFYKDKARYDECFRAYAEVFVPPNPPKRLAR